MQARKIVVKSRGYDRPMGRLECSDSQEIIFMRAEFNFCA